MQHRFSATVLYTFYVYTFQLLYICQELKKWYVKLEALFCYQKVFASYTPYLLGNLKR